MPKLFGVGIGTGDAELLTLKAIRVMSECPVIAFPGIKVTESLAYKIVSQVVDLSQNKVLIGLDMPMTNDEEILKNCHERAADTISKYLEDGNDVAFLTLGDPSIYSTYYYIHEIMVKRGYECEQISGITSPLYAASKANIKLTAKNEMLHILPAIYGIDNILSLKGTIVLMKAGNVCKKLKELKDDLIKQGRVAYYFENLGMEDEIVIKGIDIIPDKGGYFSMIIICTESHN